MAFAVNAYSETPFSAEPSDSTVVVSGLQITSAEGSITITGELGVNVFPTGQTLTVVNQIFEQDTLTAFGEAPFATQSPSIFTAPNVTVTGTANIIPTGIALTTFIGNEDTDADADVSVTGSGLTTSAGDVFAGTVVDIDVTGIQSNIDLGTPIVTPNTIAQITGQSLNTQIGIVDPSPDAMVTGVGVTATASIGSVVIGTANVDVTGIQLTASLGTPLTLANADVEVTGSSLNTFIGEETIQANANVDVTGSSITGVVGDITPISTYSVTGIGISAVIDSVVVEANADVPVTGSDLTVNTISPNIIAWAEVDTGTPVTWTTVDLAA
jgi:hypothetical protein